MHHSISINACYYSPAAGRPAQLPKCRACAQLTHCVEIGTMQLHSDKPTAFHFTAATTMNHESESKHPSADGVSCDAAERKPMPGQWKSGGDADGPVSSLKHARA